MKKHGANGKYLIWRKLHFVVDITAHEIITTEFSSSNVTNSKVLPN
ncbi:Mobile element protein [Candidatus Enterovibrio altilux]|uniref:Mobile element protein n=1 Tax=Candidatus Enterovibrio altilux TaxID=1927128 RepID=A0A291B8P9_9GAMM|nr:Mobile element protein [Candidatus Enterovibrio luxaltus]